MMTINLSEKEEEAVKAALNRFKNKCAQKALFSKSDKTKIKATQDFIRITDMMKQTEVKQ